MTLATRCIMVKAGTEYKLGQNLQNDADCMKQLHEHLCLALFLTSRPKAKVSEQKAIIRADSAAWPRPLVRDFKEKAAA